jgi:hypothetical protein
VPRISLGLGLTQPPKERLPGILPNNLCLSNGPAGFNGTYTLQMSSVPATGYGTGDIWYQNDSSAAIIKGWWNSAGFWTASNSPGPVYYQSSFVGPQVLPTGGWGGMYGNITVASGSCVA